MTDAGVPRPRVGVVTAMTSELRPVAEALGLMAAPGPRHRHEGTVGRVHVVAVVSGMGTAAARRATEELVRGDRPDHVLMVGVAGAVDPALGIGELVVPDRVVHEDTGAEWRPVPLPGHVARGVLLTTDVLHTHPDTVGELARRGIAAVDMETAAVGEVCERHEVAWSVYRAISDRAGDPSTDPGVLRLVGPDGSPRPVAAAAYLARRPWRARHLARLGSGTTMATRAAAAAAADAIHHLAG